MYIKLAWRNIWRNKRRTLITVSSIMFAVVLGVYSQSINSGSHNYMIENMSRFHTGFIQLQDAYFKDEPSLDNAFYFDDDFAEMLISQDSQIEELVPRIETFMLAAGEEQTRGALVLGVNLEREHRLNDLKDHLTEGQFFVEGLHSVVIGSGLAGRLQVSVGDTLVLLGQGRFGYTAAGKYPISGLVKHPMTDFNNQIVYMNLPDLQWLLSAEDHITALLITPTEVRHTESVAESIRNAVEASEFSVFTWPQLMPELLQAIEFDRYSGYVMLVILYVVITFGLFGTVLMMTLERLREYGVLLSVGMKRLRLGFVVLLETLFIGIIGVFVGSIVSYFIVLYFYHNPIELTGDAADTIIEMGFEPILPMAMNPNIFLAQAIIIFLVSVIISMYPIFRIWRLNILEASRS